MLGKCPNSPNCVSSESLDKKHFIEPITFEGNSIEIKNKIVEIIKEEKGEILIEDENYIKASFKSNLFKFEDIAEFKIDEESKEIKVRSAAQTGWYDFGVNRKRIEKIRRKLEK